MLFLLSYDLPSQYFLGSNTTINPLLCLDNLMYNKPDYQTIIYSISVVGKLFKAKAASVGHDKSKGRTLSNKVALFKIIGSIGH